MKESLAVALKEQSQVVARDHLQVVEALQDTQTRLQQDVEAMKLSLKTQLEKCLASALHGLKAQQDSIKQQTSCMATRKYICQLQRSIFFFFVSVIMV